MGVKFTEKDIRDKNLVWKDGKYQKIDAGTPANKVKKIEPIFFKPNDKKAYDSPNLESTVLENIMDLGISKPKTPAQLMKLFNEQPMQFYKEVVTDLTTVKIKPLTQNRAWKGRRFKSDQYKAYATAVSLLLPNDLIVPDGLLRVYYEFGMSTNSDFDNPCKMFTDILQTKYHFNDSRIMEAKIKKVIVKKGEEYIRFKIESL